VLPPYRWKKRKDNQKHQTILPKPTPKPPANENTQKVNMQKHEYPSQTPLKTTPKTSWTALYALKT